MIISSATTGQQLPYEITRTAAAAVNGHARVANFPLEVTVRGRFLIFRILAMLIHIIHASAVLTGGCLCDTRCSSREETTELVIITTVECLYSLRDFPIKSP